jgi:hypothetical protein
MAISLRILITALLTVLGCWTVYYNWPQRSVRYPSHTYSDAEARQLRFYPRAQYGQGMHAWLEQQPEKAAGFFRQAVARDVLYLDAWLRLAETEAALGRAEKARAILAFTTGMTERVWRWKWSQTLLARELGMDADFHRNTNELLSGNLLVQDTLQLLHTHLDGKASAVIAVLDPAHLPVYLDWLMRWGLADESMLVWQAMTAITQPEKTTALRYAHFLLGHKRIQASRDIWQKVTGSSGLTNPGFEKALTGQGFDWRHWGEKDGAWELKRVDNDAAEGDYALKITFNGLENISFQHLYQIFTATPQKTYRLTYAWKSTGITTDQGPLVEIVGYDQPGFYRAGSMIMGTQGWREESITFTMPAECHAAMVRLRRRASMRFDSKIRGIVWLDNFRLEDMATDVRTTANEDNHRATR